MNKPLLYQNSSDISRVVAIEILEEYSNKIKWKESGATIIDIGCADGGNTKNIFKSYCPPNFERIVACDINTEMINFAKEHNRDEKITFLVLDIEQTLPLSLVGGFDVVLSFFILHWIRNQRAAFQNFYNLLDEGGQCLVTGFADMPYFATYRKLAKQEKWAHFLKDHENYISVYNDSKDPETAVANLMKESGFKNIDVVCRKQSFVFINREALKNLIEAVNPFKIPEHRFSEYFDDFLETALENHLLKIVNKTGGIEMKYRFIIAFGTK